MFGTVENCADDPANLDAEISGPSPNLHVVVRGTKRPIRANWAVVGGMPFS